ncbi:MAG: hypothetical protein AB7G15_15355 [Alphaproteobacteria bacterium]
MTSATIARLQKRRNSPLVERRFPLHLEPNLLSIRKLYEAAKKGRWDPERHIPWDKFDAAAYDATALSAAATSWSRRAWTEYGGMPETPAILIRFCLEHNGESDPKMFLSVRGTEEAWHVECCWRFAELVGGYRPAPVNAEYAQFFNQSFHRKAFDPGVAVDAYVAAHVAVQDGIDLELHRSHLRHVKDPVAAAILKRLVTDKERHVAFGWVYLAEHAKKWSASMLADVTSEIEHVIGDLELNGYQCAWLAPNDIAAEIVAADEATRRAGLGASSVAEEAAVLKQWFGEARTAFADLGVTLRKFSHPRLGEV